VVVGNEVRALCSKMLSAITERGELERKIEENAAIE